MFLLVVIVGGIGALLIGTVLGLVSGDRKFVDVPPPAMIGTGAALTVLGFFALVSYLGFLFFHPGLALLGLGIGSAFRRRPSSTTLRQ
jgi:hypothetical protein